MEINIENCKKRFFKDREKYYDKKSLKKLINIMQNLHKKRNCEETKIVKEVILKKLKNPSCVVSSGIFSSFAQIKQDIIGSYYEKENLYRYVNDTFLIYTPKIYYDRIELIFKEVNVKNIDITEIFYFVREIIIKRSRIYIDQEDDCIILTINFNDNFKLNDEFGD